MSTPVRCSWSYLLEFSVSKSSTWRVAVSARLGRRPQLLLLAAGTECHAIAGTVADRNVRVRAWPWNIHCLPHRASWVFTRRWR